MVDVIEPYHTDEDEVEKRLVAAHSTLAKQFAANILPLIRELQASDTQVTTRLPVN
jgi:hypothetical protein